MKTADVLLVDALPVVYKATHAMGHLSYNGMKTGGVYGFLRDVNGLRKKFMTSRVYVAWDNIGEEHSYVEKSIDFKEYKANRVRTKLSEDVYTNARRVKEILTSSGWTQLKVDHYEADDIIGLWSRYLYSMGLSVMIISPDADMYSCISCEENSNKSNYVNTYWKSGKRETLMDADAMLEKFEVRPTAWVMWKVVNGDSSDNIKALDFGSRKLKAKINLFLCSWKKEYVLDQIRFEEGLDSILNREEWDLYISLQEEISLRIGLFKLGGTLSVMERGEEFFKVEQETDKNAFEKKLQLYGIKSLKVDDFMGG